MKEKYKEIFDEVMDEIESSLKDSRGITAHQRRLAFSLSFGMINLLEFYLNKLNVLKPGAKINHLWLKKKRDNAKKLISSQITSQIDSIENIDKILDAAFKIESERNELVYGKKVSEDALNERINLFLDLKKELEND
jgi:hypothetical protein